MVAAIGLALKRPWLVPRGPPLTLTAWTGLEYTLSPCRGLVSGKRATPHPDYLDRLRIHYCEHVFCAKCGQNHKTAY